MKSESIYTSFKKRLPYLDIIGQAQNSKGVSCCCAISPWYVLIADHTRQGDDNISVQFINEKPNKLVGIENIYNGGDIALGRLERKTLVKRPSVHYGNVKIRETCLVAGWGIGNSRELRWGWSNILGTHHTEGFGYIGWSNKHGPIAEPGDSGGPILVIRNQSLVLAGIIIGGNNHSRFKNNLGLSTSLLTQRFAKKGNSPKNQILI